MLPSSNVTIEAELATLLARQPDATFSFHSSRMRMPRVSAAGLIAMSAQRDRCIIEIADAHPDVVLYANVAALTSAGPAEHRRVESLIAEQLSLGGSQAKVRTSVGALVEALNALNARRIALVLPYTGSLAATVIECLQSEWFEVVDWAALGVEDYGAIAEIRQDQIIDAARSLNLSDVDALVISVSSQMPSLTLVQRLETECGIAVVSAATAASYAILKACNLPVNIGGAGSLLQRDKSSTFPSRDARPGR
ncbi:maleate cis-trans isomerase [Mycobacterium vicinigordonae]|uniref:maleate cis-trans isomerase family protein n=1 Tax=Mycobacterium vicinigordonae TaxID=1719132 RepID=UPI0031B5B11E